MQLELDKLLLTEEEIGPSFPCTHRGVKQAQNEKTLRGVVRWLRDMQAPVPLRQVGIANERPKPMPSNEIADELESSLNAWRAVAHQTVGGAT